MCEECSAGWYRDGARCTSCERQAGLKDCRACEKDAKAGAVACTFCALYDSCEPGPLLSLLCV